MNKKNRIIAPLWTMALLFACSLFAGTGNLMVANAHPETAVTMQASANTTQSSDSAAPTAAAPGTVNDQQASEEFYHSTLQKVKDNFLWQDRLGDWNMLMHKYDGKLQTMADAHKAINASLATLNDGYTYFKDEQLTKNSQTASGRQNVVTWYLVPNTNIGYIKIHTFGSTETANEVAAAMRAMPTAKAYVLDLRDNGGGYIWQSLEVFSMFVDNASFATVKGMKDGAAYTEDLAVDATSVLNTENGKVVKTTRSFPNLAGNKPVIILVNGDSASASEMLAGAMLDNNRATLLGTHTYGKGIAQLTYNLNHNTSVQVTFAYDYWPKGACIHKIGIEPNRVVKPTKSGDAQLDAAVADLQKTLVP